MEDPPPSPSPSYSFFVRSLARTSTNQELKFSSVRSSMWVLSILAMVLSMSVEAYDLSIIMNGTTN